MHDYLTDQDRGSDMNVKPMTSINDVLRDSKAARDRNKVGRLSSMSAFSPNPRLRSSSASATPISKPWTRI